MIICPATPTSVVDQNSSSLISPETQQQQQQQQQPQQKQQQHLVSDDSLLNLSVKDLNRRLQGLPKSEVAKVKRKRRTLKNWLMYYDVLLLNFNFIYLKKGLVN